MYWKITKDNKIIDVLEFLVYVVAHPYKDKLLIATEDNAMGLLSSDQNKIYHLQNQQEFPNDNIHTTECINVEIEEIGVEEYTLLKEALDENTEVEEPVEESQENLSIATVKAAKISQMSKACHQIITEGFDVELSDGTIHHFDLSVEDQINIVSLKDAIDSGATTIPYHASDEVCIFYSAEDILRIIDAGSAFKTYQVTYFNSLKQYINAMRTFNQLESVEYGMEIPAKYQSEVLIALNAEREE